MTHCVTSYVTLIVASLASRKAVDKEAIGKTVSQSERLIRLAAFLPACSFRACELHAEDDRDKDRDQTTNHKQEHFSQDLEKLSYQNVTASLLRRREVLRSVVEHLEGWAPPGPGEASHCDTAEVHLHRHGLPYMADAREASMYGRHPVMQGFDGSRAAPSLVRALKSGELSVKGKRVLVPGCGYPLSCP